MEPTNSKPATNSNTNTNGINQKPANSPYSEKDKALYYGPYGMYLVADYDKPPVNTYKIHDVANSLHEYDIANLVDSIKTRGQLDPILLWQQYKGKALMVANGRHRMWACNVLGIKVDYRVLNCKEEELPRAILDQQLLSRGTDKVFATITMMEYLLINKGSATALVKEYSNLAIAPRDIGDAKTIHSLMPLWITALKLGKGIKLPGSGHAEVKSLRAIAKVCREMQETAKAMPSVYEPQLATPEAKAMGKLMNTVRTVIASSEDIITAPMKRYILEQLLREFSDVPILQPLSDSYEPYTGEIYGELL